VHAAFRRRRLRLRNVVYSVWHRPQNLGGFTISNHAQAVSGSATFSRHGK